MIFLSDLVEAAPLLGFTAKYVVLAGLLVTVSPYVFSFRSRPLKNRTPRNWVSIARDTAHVLALLALQIGIALFALQNAVSTKASLNETGLLLSSIKLSFSQSSVCEPTTTDVGSRASAEAVLRSANVLWPVAQDKPMQRLSPSAAIPCDRLPIYNVVPEMREIGRLRASSHRLFIAGGIASLIAVFGFCFSNLRVRRPRTHAAMMTQEGDATPPSQDQSAFKAKW
ncbi:hypothetical protein [Pandoraea sp. ISTKB]|uniref:hypothetical protein n=1 Tax=Pandoraea sp. ISTKB TaxID=1586708 RepID=UPI00084645AB|nr:hypothetical protein [Pandoraea sp. ISTKB]ODP35116.1 hypothetical protein A9762_12200 [Pandoraea sp. ISTKB]